MILNIAKPKGLTSHDVVNKVRHLTNESKVGHGGTLDPLATGVLIIGVGRESTKKLEELLKGTDKEYEASIELGKSSSTDDAGGEIKTVNESLDTISEEMVKETLLKFKGSIEQTPPAYSALKIKGTRAYKIARKGGVPDLQPRQVEIKEIELMEFDPPNIKIRTVVSSGTYIRVLAKDIGKALGTSGYLKNLVRTRVGNFNLKDSLDLERLSLTRQMSNTKDGETKT